LWNEVLYYTMPSDSLSPAAMQLSLFQQPTPNSNALVDQAMLNIGQLFYPYLSRKDILSLSETSRAFNRALLNNSSDYQVALDESLLQNLFNVVDINDASLDDHSGNTVKPLLLGMSMVLPSLLEELPSKASQLSTLQAFAVRTDMSYSRSSPEETLHLSDDEAKMLISTMRNLSETWPIARNAGDTTILEEYLENLKNLATSRTHGLLTEKALDAAAGFIGMIDDVEKRREQFEKAKTEARTAWGSARNLWNSDDGLDRTQVKRAIRSVARVASVVWVLEDPLLQETYYRGIKDLYLTSPQEFRISDHIQLLLQGLRGVENNKVCFDFLKELKAAIPNHTIGTARAASISHLLKAYEILQRLTHDQHLQIIDELKGELSTLTEGKHLVIDGLAQALRHAQALGVVKDPKECLKRFDEILEETLKLEDETAKAHSLGSLAKVLDLIEAPAERTERFKILANAAFEVIKQLVKEPSIVGGFAAGLGSLGDTEEENEFIPAHEHRLRWINQFQQKIEAQKNKIEQEKNAITPSPSGDDFDAYLADIKKQDDLASQIEAYNLLMPGFISTTWHIKDMNDRHRFFAHSKNQAASLVFNPKGITKTRNRRWTKGQKKLYDKITKQLAYTIPALAPEYWISYATQLHPSTVQNNVNEAKSDALNLLKTLEARHRSIAKHRRHPMVSNNHVARA
jgi:hypothetical protein